ncbi:hypothetical protein BCR34DRAFT_602445 [Clohesyomyces aquaticus]|uniref:Apple domain-containing protein n=1 Tax=Clohesyomyces aquaticus TaxID=1231657 RepID=A0A1Y1ZIY5_9PLEO|nr:hypothetical protein BCR34DRAFT_602445 [Clohesyomyces aquaticus]
MVKATLLALSSVFALTSAFSPSQVKRHPRDVATFFPIPSEAVTPRDGRTGTAVTTSSGFPTSSPTPKLGDEYQIACETDYLAGDIQTSNDLLGCLQACSATDGCVAISYSGRFCYLKNSINPPVPNPNVIGAKQISFVPRPTPNPGVCSSNLLCPSDDDCIFTGTQPANITETRSFHIRCSRDFYGGDMRLAQVGSFDECVQLCTVDELCVAVSYASGEVNFCYLKSTIDQEVFNPRIYGAFIVG